MDRPIKLGEFIIGVITFLVALIMMGYNRGTMDTKIIEKQVTQDKKIEDLEQRYQRVDEKLDKMGDGINDIKIMLQNKQDRQ